MRILVFSDSHGAPYYMHEALMRQRAAEVVFFLGDGMRDFENLRTQFPEKAFVAVRGNCDMGTKAPELEVRDIDGARIFAAHGHAYAVKSGLLNAVYAAREKKANILLFGHTHQALTTYDDGLYIMNPGAISGFRPSYGAIDITKAGIATNIFHIN